MYHLNSPQKGPAAILKERGISGVSTYIDKLGKIKIEIDPQSCTVDDVNKAINFLQSIKAQKE